MSNEVTLSVASKLNQIVDDLQKIAGASEKVSKSIKGAGNSVGDGIENQKKKTTGFLTELRGVSARVANEIKSDFKALIGLQALMGATKMSNMFGNTIRDSIGLGDKVRKLGPVFGLVQNQFAEFESRLTKGMGDIGLGAAEATDALEGLSHTQVRGQDNLLSYSQQSGALAQLSGQKGHEGEIAEGIANAIRDVMGNVNDPAQMKQMAEEIRRIFNVTGEKPTEILSELSDIFKTMPDDLRKATGINGAASLATASAVAGPQSVAFMKEFLGASKIQRAGFEAQGFKGIFGKDGLDIEKFKKASDSIISRVGGDKRLAASTLGLSPEAAEGFVRLSESIDKVQDAEERRRKATGNVIDQMHQGMTMSEAFAASINKVKAAMAGPLSKLQEKGTELLTHASESGAGAAAVTLGAGGFAAVLAGGALRTLASAMPGGKFLAGKGIGFGEAAGVERLTGKAVQNVYVVNAEEMGLAGGSGVGALGGGAGTAAGGGVISSMLKTAGMVAAISAAAYAANELSKQKGAGINIGGEEKSLSDVAEMAVDTMTDKPQLKEAPKQKFNGVEDLYPTAPAKNGFVMPSGPGTAHTQYVNVKITEKPKDMKTSVETGKGSAH